MLPFFAAPPHFGGTLLDRFAFLGAGFDLPLAEEGRVAGWFLPTGVLDFLPTGVGGRP